MAILGKVLIIMVTFVLGYILGYSDGSWGNFTELEEKTEELKNNVINLFDRK